MISQLMGTILFQENNYIILNVSDVGYKISVTIETAQNLKTNEKSRLSGGSPLRREKITLWTHLAVRENSLDLYGFLEKTDLDFFEMLITISGIGPKTALGILNVATVDTLISAISSKDTSYLTKVSGIGQKNAEKIILELKNKIGTIDNSEVNNQNDLDAIDALKALGYSSREALEALKKVDKTVTDVSQKIKTAIKFL